MASESNNSNKKFYVRKVRQMSGMTLLSVYLVAEIDKENKKLLLVGPNSSLKIIDLDQLFWGRNVGRHLGFSLLNFENNIVIDSHDLSDISYWTVEECNYGEYCHDQLDEPFSFHSMLCLDFHVKNNKLHAETGIGSKFGSKKIELSEIIFCPALKFDPSACFPYPVKNTKELKSEQPVLDSPLSNEINSVPKECSHSGPINNCWKNMLESVTTYSVNTIAAEEKHVVIAFNYPFVTIKEKPNTMIIDNLITSIKLNECEIFKMSTNDYYIYIFFK